MFRSRDDEKREAERVEDDWLRAWSERTPDPEPPSPTQPLSLRDGDLLLIGRQGAVDEKGYVELGERFELSGVVV